MWTTGDPRCSQCLWLSRSGWGQPSSSSPGRAAPRGFRYLSPARQQLVPIVVPKKESPPMAAQRRPAVAPPASLPPERGARPELRRRGSAATGLWVVPAGPGPGEWLLEPVVREIPALRIMAPWPDRIGGSWNGESSDSPRLQSGHGATRGWVGYGSCSTPSAPATQRGRGAHAVPGWVPQPECRARMHGPVPDALEGGCSHDAVAWWAGFAQSTPVVRIYGRHVRQGFGTLITRGSGATEAGIDRRELGRILPVGPRARRARSRRRIVPPAALTPAFAGPYHRCFGAISAPDVCLPSTLTGLRESFP
jgi:hypothetical protein